MIHGDDRGPQSWNGVHVTHRTTVAELIDVDNVGPQGVVLTGFDMFRNAGECLDEVIRRAREAGKRILAIGSGWALSDSEHLHAGGETTGSWPEELSGRRWHDLMEPPPSASARPHISWRPP